MTLRYRKWVFYATKYPEKPMLRHIEIRVYGRVT